MKSSVIFLHSLFRTGSTYVWHTFRQHGDFYCYYEPFHKHLLTMNPQTNMAFTPSLFEQMHHPNLERHYFFEYERLATDNGKGIPFFKKSFIVNEFCNNEKNQDLKKYIDFLIAHTDSSKSTIFQFNRSALRSQWFSENYPYALNAYIVRNPRNQWESYLHYLRTVNGFFLASDVMAASLNCTTSFFAPLARIVPLVSFISNSIDYQEIFYSIAVQTYSLAELYFIFYYTWLISLIENTLHCNITINMDLLSESETYRVFVKEQIQNATETTLDFSDTHIRHYDSFTISQEDMNILEKQVIGTIFNTLPENIATNFFEKLNKYDKEYFRFNKTDIPNTSNLPKPYDNEQLSALTSAKQRNITELLIHSFIMRSQKQTNPNSMNK